MAHASAADLVVTNARVWTGDPEHPEVEALAVLGERIAAVGSRSAIEGWRGPRTRVIDARARRVVPGFDDAHLHFPEGSAKLTQVKLKDARSAQELARRIGAHLPTLSGGEWVLGGSWDEQAFEQPRLPTRADVDPVTPERPVLVDRCDGHAALANSAALRLAGITRRTATPAGGEIVKDASGEPTGILKDAAIALVRRHVPDPGREARLRALRRGLACAASFGVTSAQDMNPAHADMDAYVELEDRGELTLRLRVAPLATQWGEPPWLGLRDRPASLLLRLGAVKGFADGSLGSRTACFFQPYTDDQGTRGLLSDEMRPLARMRDRLLRADAAGLQLCIHAIGDRAVSTVLDLFEDVSRVNGPRDRRWRIEHAQHLVPGDVARFARLGVIASVQPYHAIDDGRWAEDRIGLDRCRTAYAFRALLDARVPLALGTDWPVAPLDPLQTLHAAVTRATLDGRHPDGWIPEQRMTLEEALRAYTAGAAYAEFQDRERGTLTPGKLADLVLLSEDPFAIAPERLAQVRVETTVVAGRVVFERGR